MSYVGRAIAGAVIGGGGMAGYNATEGQQGGIGKAALIGAGAMMGLKAIKPGNMKNMMKSVRDTGSKIGSSESGKKASQLTKDYSPGLLRGADNLASKVGSLTRASLKGTKAGGWLSKNKLTKPVSRFAGGAVPGAMAGAVAGGIYGGFSSNDSMMSGAFKGALVGAAASGAMRASGRGISSMTKAKNPINTKLNSSGSLTAEQNVKNIRKDIDAGKYNSAEKIPKGANVLDKNITWGKDTQRSKWSPRISNSKKKYAEANTNPAGESLTGSSTFGF